MRELPLISLLVLLILTSGMARAGDADYQQKVKPLLVKKCGTCHGALKQEAGLRLDASQLIRQGSESGPVVSPGDSGSSLLLQRVVSADVDERMPPEGEGEPLDAQQVALLQAWIDAGAPSPEEEPVPVGPQDHWAYQVLKRPEVPIASLPATSETDISGNPIDAFLGAAQEAGGVTPFPPADKPTLLRRVTIDLIGLPPTRDQLHEFLSDESDDAYERLVDRLLESPQHGERWARHWMDVWRYSDWDGYKKELRGSQRHIWRWRDWIIESLNADKGYDQMVREMLAGDELAPDDPGTLRATGFLARNYHNSNRNIWLDATVEHTAKAFLGMTINCARCHEHKFDPIDQTDYYAFRAIFEPHDVRTERLPGEPDLMKDGLARVFDAKPEAKTFLYIGGNEKHPDKEHPLVPNIPGSFGRLTDITEVPLPVTAWFPSAQESIHQENMAAAEGRLAQARQALAKWTAEHRAAEDGANGVDRPVEPSASCPPAPPLAFTMPLDEQLVRAKVRAAETALASLRARWAADEARYVNQDEEAAGALAVRAAKQERAANLQQAAVDVLQKEQALLKAGEEKDDAKRKRATEKAQKELAAAREKQTKAREALGSDDAKYTSVGKVYPKTSTGRRLALARWITDRDNPFTARVAVNHIWLRHFGEPLVENVFDFGLRSPRPKRADLLDWLAVELMDNGWSMKRLHRLIVTSSAFRRASAAETALTAANRTVDPDNRLLWRANVRRLDAEVVRDSVLAVAGSLDTTTGGPDIDYHQGETVPRRSLYFQHAYEKQMTMLVLFDAANPTDCYRRSESIIPQQVLALSNSSLTLTESRKLARQLWEAAQPRDDAERAFLHAAFEQVLSRAPTEDELVTCLEFLTGQSARLSDDSALTDFGGKTEATVPASDDPAMRARENLIHVLMNHNDFVTMR